MVGALGEGAALTACPYPKSQDSHAAPIFPEKVIRCRGDCVHMPHVRIGLRGLTFCFRQSVSRSGPKRAGARNQRTTPTAGSSGF